MNFPDVSKRTKFFAYFLVAAALVVGSRLSLAGSSGDGDAKNIVRKADSHRMPPGQLSFLAVVEDFEHGKKIRETRYNVLYDGAESRPSSLVETIYPERQRGRKLLSAKDNLWFYTPDIKRAARVSMEQRLTGEIANGDLVSTDFYRDYDAKLDGKDDVDGTSAYRLKLKANHSGVTYSKIDYWVAEKTYLPLKAVFYAVSGKPLKRGLFLDPKEVLGHQCVTRVKFTDFIDSNKQSTLLYRGHKKANFSSSVFSKESLSE